MRDEMTQVVEAIYRAESRRVLATLIRLLRDFDIAEEALHDAFAAALTRWPAEGVPANPVAWLVSAGRFRALDHLRRRAVGDRKLQELAFEIDRTSPEPVAEAPVVEDDRLRLVFTCCHPVLAPEARVALTLRTVCGLTTEEIARAYLVPAPTLAQRIVRAKARIRDARIPYVVPEAADLPDRLAAVLQVIYLVFNEGYAATAGPSVTRADLAAEAIRLGRLVTDLTDEAEARGLLALMLLHDARRAARMSPGGDLVLLEDQDRRRWDRAQMDEGRRELERALRAGSVGPYRLQAAIAAVHADARDAASTDWAQIVVLYDMLRVVSPSPVVELNRAVAVAMERGPAAGLVLMDDLVRRGELESYAPLHAARGDLLVRLKRCAEALEAFRRARALATQEPERRFLDGRIHEALHHVNSGH